MIIHKKLAAGRWFKLSLMEQLANVGSDVERTIKWRNRENKEYCDKAFDRTLELLDLTIADPKNRKRLKEVTRMREVLVDYFMYDNEYGSSDKLWQQYFLNFAFAAAIQRNR